MLSPSGDPRDPVSTQHRLCPTRTGVGPRDARRPRLSSARGCISQRHRGALEGLTAQRGSHGTDELGTQVPGGRGSASAAAKDGCRGQQNFVSQCAGAGQGWGAGEGGVESRGREEGERRREGGGLK